MNFNQKAVLDLIHHVSDTIISPNFNNPDLVIREKTSPLDLQTEADKQSERVFMEELPNILPGSIVMGEETADARAKEGEDPYFELRQPDIPVWVIDPIDGTRNFAQGREIFGLMLSLVMNEAAAYGWIYDIPGKRMAYAQAGKGAYLDGEPVNVQTEQTDWQNIKGFSHRSKVVKQYEAEHGKIEIKSLNCAAHEYLALLSGERDFAIYKNTKPWDHLAGSLILNEAGGLVKHWDGLSYNPLKKDSGIVCAKNEDVVETIRPYLKP